MIGALDILPAIAAIMLALSLASVVGWLLRHRPVWIGRRIRCEYCDRNITDCRLYFGGRDRSRW